MLNLGLINNVRDFHNEEENMSKTEKAATSVVVMIVFSLGSKFLGFLREILIASKFGAGMETDTFFIAIAVSGLFTTLIGAALNTTMIPVLSEIQVKEGIKGKVLHTNNILNIVVVLSILLVFTGWVGAPLLVKLLAKGFTGQQFELAVYLTRIGIPVLFFSLIQPVLRSYLQSEMMFTETAASAFPFNFVYIFFLIFLSGKFGIVGLVVANTLAVASQILLQFYGLKKSGYKYKFIFDLKDIYVRKILLLTVPIFIGTTINEINIIVDKTLASSLIEGSISALNYATRLNSLILGVFITAITTVIYPMLSEQSNNGNIVKMKKIMGYGINSILLITIPSTIGLIVLSKPIVEVVFQRGEFDIQATILTSQALIFYSMGLVATGLRPMIGRVFFSLQDTKTPMINGAIAVVFNVIFNLILVTNMAHRGLALSTSLSNIIAVALLFITLKKKIGSLCTLSYIKCGLKAGLASAIMGVVAYVVYHGLYGILGISKLYNFISLLVAIVLAVIVYGVLCYLFGIEEIRDIVDKVMKKLKSKSHN